MNKILNLLRIIFIVGLISCLTDCGGGGGGGGGGPDLSACQNFSAPPQASLNYTGSTSAATLDETSASPMVSRTMLVMLQLANVIPTLPIDQTITQASCFDTQGQGVSGQAKYLTFVHNDESGWENIQYNDYINSTPLGFLGNVYTLNGTAYATFDAVSSNDLQVNETISLYNYHVVLPSYMDITLNGTLNLTVQRVVNTSPFNFSTPVTANLVIEDNLNKTTTWLNNFQYSDNSSLPAPQFDTARSLTGRLYDSQTGYADLSTLKPFFYYIAAPLGGYPFQYSEGGGPIKFMGASTSIVYATPLNSRLFSIALDTNGDGILEKSVRLNWSNLQLDNTPWPNLVGPVPIAAVDATSASLVVGQAMPLEGLRSYSPLGYFVNYKWTEIFAPPGSTAVLSNTQSATPSFTPNLPGDYSFQLTVSDGMTSNNDHIVVTVINAGDTIPNTDYNGITGPDLQTHTGQAVTIDARASQDYVPGHPEDGHITHVWTLIPPPGSNTQLSDPSGDQLRPQFTPDISGFYAAVLGASRQIIAVDTGIDFQKPVTLRHAGPTDIAALKRFVVGDFNGDGIPDIAVIADISNPTLSIYYGTAQGGFSVPVNIPLADTANFSYIEAKDVNNDGRTDIVIGGSGTYAMLQQADGTMASPQQIAVNSSCGSLLLAVGPWQNATTNSIYTVGVNCVDIYNYVSGTQFVSSGIFPFIEDGTVPLAQIGSVTGDNLADILVFSESDLNNPTLDVFAGQSDGSFVKQASYLIPGAGDQYSEGEFVTGDFNHDGLQDAAAMAGNNIDVLLQNSNGSFSPVVQYSLFPSSLQFNGGIAAGDINNDGYTDLITKLLGYKYAEPNYFVSYVGILLQNNNQTFNSTLLYPFYVGTSLGITINPTQITDLNNDGMSDIIMFDGSGNLILLYQIHLN